MTAPALPREGVKFSNFKLINPPVHAKVQIIQMKSRTFHVEVVRDGKETKKMKPQSLDGDRVWWDDSVSFAGEILDDTFITFKIVETSFKFIKTTVGEYKDKLIDLLDLQDKAGICEVGITKDCQLEFMIERVADILPNLLDEARVSLSKTPALDGAAKIAQIASFNTYANQEQTWTSFLSQFQTFMNTMDQISEVNSYAKLAWSVLSVIPKTILSQKGRNDNIKKLVDRLAEVYKYVADSDRLRNFETTQKETLSVLVRQTVECAYFIRGYCLGNIAEQLWKGASIDGKIQEINAKFDHIMTVLTGSIVLNNYIVTLRISETTTNTHELTLLEGMPYDANAGLDSEKRCLAGTRQQLINDILEWVNNEPSKRILLLSGQAGMGKSSIAHTIAEIFSKHNRLGSLFCFNRSYKDRRSFLFSTISRNLADKDDLWKDSLVQIIAKKDIRTSLDMKTQFEQLLVKPSNEVTTIGPVVIVIDALDESGDRQERGSLLELLFERCSELPPNYRFIITSRPEPDIEPWYQYPTVTCKQMADIRFNDTLDDIRRYISVKLSSVAKTLDNELEDDWRFLLTSRSEGLFQWAYTACRVINPTVKFGIAERVKSVISRSTSLYELYYQILNSQPEFENDAFLDAFKCIIGAVVMAREPLSIMTLQSLFQDSISNVKEIIEPFHSLFIGTHDMHSSIRPLHTSLTDFFTTPRISPKQENQYYIDTSDQHDFTLGCLRTMNRMLRFNICKLETSHISNYKIPDFYARMTKANPLHLSYACSYWSVHLQSSKVSDDLMTQARILIRTNVLFLFELLSLLTEIEEGCQALRTLAAWCKDSDDELADQALDACQFASDFREAIESSTPHLYLSALPFAPRDSFIAQQYLKEFPRLFNIEIGQSNVYSGGVVVMEKYIAYPSNVTALAFSPLGRYVAVGFVTGKFWFLDHETGEIIYQWGQQSDGISSIVFSLDGHSIYCCFGRGSIMFWTISTRAIAVESHEGLLEGCQFCTITADGRYLVLHSKSDLVLYDREEAASKLRLGDRKDKMAISPNGCLLATRDNTAGTVSLWNIQTQTIVGSWLLNSWDWRNATFAFSPDSTHIAFGTGSAIQVWNVKTMMQVVQYKRPNCGLHNLAFLLDNQCLLFSELIGGISVWNISTGDLMWESLLDFGSFKGASSDSKYIAMVRGNDLLKNGSLQVRRWQLAPSESNPPPAHVYFRKPVFSPQGRYLLLEYNDPLHTTYIKILDAATMKKVIHHVGPCDSTDGYIRHLGVQVSSDDEYIAYVSTQGLCVWNEKEGEWVLEDSSHNISYFSFAASGDRLISSNCRIPGELGEVKIWDIHTRHLIRAHTILGDITSLAISSTPSGSTFVVQYRSYVSRDVFEIRESDSGELLHGPSPWESCPPVFLFPADEAPRIAFRIQAGRFKFFDERLGDIMQRFADEVNLEISPNSEYLGWFDDEWRPTIWDINAEAIVDGRWSESISNRLCFNVDRRFITIDKEFVRIWDIPSGREAMAPIRINKRSGLSVPLTGRQLVTIEPRDRFKIWSLETHAIMSHAYQHHERHSEFGMFPAESDIDGTIETLLNRYKSAARAEEQETLQFALTAWNNALFGPSSKLGYDGWVRGPHDECLFWIPEERRQGLWFPNMTLLGATRHITKLNFDNFVHGSRWVECYKGDS